MKLIWTKRALRELAEILSYITKDSPQNADLVGSRIYGASMRLVSDPFIGRSSAIANTRLLVVSDTPYVISYTISRKAIYLKRVQRGARIR